MRLVKHLVHIAPFAFIACDASVDVAPNSTAENTQSLTIESAAAAVEPGECKLARRDFEPVAEDAELDNAACVSDSDCTVAVTDTMCLGLAAHAVSFGGLDAFMLKTAKADARWCASVPDSCGANDAVAASAAVCNDGMCELVAAKTACDAGETQTREGCLDCEDARGKAHAALAAVADAANACESDAECVAVIDMTGCASSCGAAINRQNAGSFVERMGAIVTDYCSGDCGVAVDCAATRPACVQKRCELVADQ